ncbi:CARDB domain-containing protein, partial [Haloferax profundi]|uniref:CARDB domain-containing protein n=1 Tax=Haloferax profundi TaxID=1544718 RepID=UPI0018D233AE
MFYTARVNDSWLQSRTYADGSAQNLTFWQGDSVATDTGFVSVFAGKDLGSEQAHDLYVFRQQFRPDLGVTVTTPPSNATVGANVTTNVTVRNHGDLTSDPSEVVLTAGSTELDSAAVPTLAPNETATAQLNGTVDTNGTLTITVDPDETLDEFSEENNHRTLTLAKPNLAVKHLEAVRWNDSLIVSATVNNPSQIRAPATTATITNGPNATFTTAVPALDPGANEEI